MNYEQGDIVELLTNDGKTWVKGLVVFADAANVQNPDRYYVANVGTLRILEVLDESLLRHYAPFKECAQIDCAEPEEIEIEEENQTQHDIRLFTTLLRDMLLKKNRKYGDAALSPMRVFSDLSPIEMIKVRMDDKLSRIQNGAADEDEDPIFDLAGYLILMLIARQRESRETLRSSDTQQDT